MLLSNECSILCILAVVRKCIKQYSLSCSLPLCLSTCFSLPGLVFLFSCLAWSGLVWYVCWSVCLCLLSNRASPISNIQSSILRRLLKRMPDGTRKYPKYQEDQIYNKNTARRLSNTKHTARIIRIRKRQLVDIIKYP